MNGLLTSYEMTALRSNTTYRLVVLPRTSAGDGVDNFIDVTTMDETTGGLRRFAFTLHYSSAKRTHFLCLGYRQRRLQHHL